MPKPKKRTALLRKLKEIFRRYVSQPVGRVVEVINPIRRGWVRYFAVGHSSRCFSYVMRWVEKPTRKKRTMSAAGRKRIAAAQRARWAKVRAAKKRG